MKTLVKKKLTQLFSVVKKVLPKEISHKRSAVFLFSVIVLGGIALLVEPIHAESSVLGAAASSVGDSIGTWITKAFMGMSVFFIKMAIFFLQYFIAIAGWNSYLDVATVMLGWTMVRDVANMFFVVILLVIAFGTILGIEQYQWNKTLIKLILAAVFINFSNLICGIFIDAAHVFTITFVNAVSATAGGNFIQAFKFQELYTMLNGTPPDGATDFSMGLFVGALASLIFAILAMCIIAVYAMIMLARMVALWVLVIFSPLAFILQVLPGTQSYAKQWWDKFMKQVLVAPVMVFFLWLTFATVGSGSVASEIDLKISSTAESGAEIKSEIKSETATSLNEATTWANMASFFIPLALMIVGMNVVQQMGVVGGGLVQSGQAMAKKIAGYATGYNAAKFAGRKGWEGTKKAVSAVGKEAWDSTIGDMAKRTGKRIQRARMTMPYVRAIPIIGGLGKLRREKLNKEADRGLEMTKKNIQDTISRPENYSWRDKVGDKLSVATGGRIGFGMGHLKGIRYDLEKAEDIIQAEKGESRRRRKAKNLGGLQEEAINATSDIGEDIAKEQEAQLKVFIESSDDNRDKYGEVGDDFIGDGTGRSIEQVETARFEREKKEEMLRGYERVGGDGERLKKESEDALTNLNTEENKEKDLFAEMVKKQLTVAEGEFEGLFVGELNTFSDEDRKRIVTERKSRASKKGLVDFEVGSAEYEEETDKVIRDLLKNGHIALSQDSGIGEKMLLEEANRHLSGDANLFTNFDAARVSKEIAETKFKDKTTEYDKGFEVFSADSSNIARAENITVNKGGDLNQRIATAREKKVTAENTSRQNKARQDFLASAEGKEFAKKSKSKIYDRAEEIAKKGYYTDANGKRVEIKTARKDNKTGKVTERKATMGDRQAVAEAVRNTMNHIDADTVEAQQKQANAELSQEMYKLPFGEQQMMLKNSAEQLQAASDNFVENLKNIDLKKNMAEAAEEIEKAMKGGAKSTAEALEAAFKKQKKSSLFAYANAAVQQELLVKTKEGMTMDQTTLNETAKTYAVEKPSYGISTPSTSLVPLAERLTTDLKTMESQDAAAFGAKQMGYLLTQNKQNGELDRHQQAFMFGTAMHLGRNGWIDDMISEIKKKITKLQSGELSGDEAVEAESLREVFVDELGILSQKDGKYISAISKADRVAKIENLMASGADVDLVKSHAKVDQTMQEAKEKGSVKVGAGTQEREIKIGDSYKQVMEKMAEAGELYVDTAEDFNRRLERSSEFLQEASSFFKREAINVGHQEYGGHQQYDSDMGAYRMATGEQAKELMAAETRKFGNKLKWQYHGLGEADLDRGRLTKIDAQYYKNQMEELTSSRAAKQVPERTRDAALGYEFGKSINMDGEYAMIGESAKVIQEEYGGLANYMKSVLFPEIEGNSEALKFLLREKGNHVDFINSDRGVFKGGIAGTDIKGELYSDFLIAFKKAASQEKDESGNVILDVHMEKILDTAIASSKQKERSIHPKDLSDRDPAEAEEASGELL